MRTLVLSPRYTSDSRALRAAALEAGWSVERLGNWRAPERLQGRELALYGEPLFVEVIASKLGLAMLDAPFDWLLHLPAHYRKRAIALTTLEATRALSEPMFVKPADGRKAFEGLVYSSGTQLPAADALPDDTLVFTAEPVIWELEFRCFILERQAITISPYWRASELALTAEGVWQASPTEFTEAQAYIDALLADPEVLLPPAVVVDIGILRERGWAVVEANTAWGAGIYGCDPTRVLSVLARACISNDQLAEADAQWALNRVELL